MDLILALCKNGQVERCRCEVLEKIKQNNKREGSWKGWCKGWETKWSQDGCLMLELLGASKVERGGCLRVGCVLLEFQPLRQG